VRRIAVISFFSIEVGAWYVRVTIPALVYGFTQETELWVGAVWFLFTFSQSAGKEDFFNSIVQSQVEVAPFC